jgi:hypothetical protein
VRGARTCTRLAERGRVDGDSKVSHCSTQRCRSQAPELRGLARC